MITLQCTLKRYLSELREIELTKPIVDRRHVPTLADIASEADINYSTISKYANNHIKSVNISTAIKIIEAVRARGFDMQISDFIDIYELQS